MPSNVHSEIVQFFAKLIKENKLHHAYSLVGPTGVGKRGLVKTIAAQILQTTAEKIFQHPDWLWIEQTVNEKTGKTKRDIDVEQIQVLRNFALYHSLTGGYKVVVIHEAEKMNEYSQNALLKTLEEPSAETVFFLLTENEQELLPTLQSRVQTIFVMSLQDAVIEQNLLSQGLEQKQAQILSRIAHGLPQVAESLQDSKNFLVYENERKRFEELFGEPFFKKLQAVEPLFGDKKDHIAAREELQKILGLWQMFSRDMLLLTVGVSDGVLDQNIKSTFYPKNIFLDINKKIIQAKNYLNQNIHPRLLIEEILLSIP